LELWIGDGVESECWEIVSLVSNDGTIVF